MAGAVSTGAVIRAAEVLGADLAYLGTRFIATRSPSAGRVQGALVSQTSTDLAYTGDIAGVPANWMVESMRRVGLDPDNLPKPGGRGMRHDHFAGGRHRPGRNLWSAGQGIDLIDDIPSVAELVRRLRARIRRRLRAAGHERAGQVDARRGRRAGDLTQAARSAVNSIVPAIGPPPLDTATTCAPAT